MMKAIKRFLVLAIWEIGAWCLERICVMLDVLESIYEELIDCE